MKKTMFGILVGAAALAHAPPEASAAMIVDSDRNFFSTRFAVFAEPDSGQALAQSFTLDADFELDSLSVYAKGDAASIYIVEALAPSLTRADMIWSTDFSAGAFDWQTFNLEGLTSSGSRRRAPAGSTSARCSRHPSRLAISQPRLRRSSRTRATP